jgi:glutamate synthase (NADPH/NADH) small chain
MNPKDPISDIRSHRLETDEIIGNFSDLHPPLSRSEALIAADRCYFCYDAPCTAACPTGIDIPGFIQKIRSDNQRGSARTILEENIMGGMCARVCPTEVLCEEACVRNTHEEKPVEIGLLQRYATDPIFDTQTPLFSRGPATGKKVAVVGGGPAGLS